MYNFYLRLVQSTLVGITSLVLLPNYQLPKSGLVHLNNIGLVSGATIKKYEQNQIDYFLEVAFDSEYGFANSTIKKWDETLTIQVLGSPTSEDLKTLNSVIGEINTLAKSVVVQIDNNNPNVELYFVPESEFSQYEPHYLPVNYGFVWNWWNNDVIQKSRILISTVKITQKERSHLIREELTQALGLMKDSDRYAESIFYQEWTDITDYADIDKAVIEMLYQPEIRPGMTRSQVVAILQRVSNSSEVTF